jgi:RNA polymerase sigma-70 factor (ECF subfamily)
VKESIDEPLLVKQVLSGNRKAFEGLVRQYEGLVLHIVTPLIGVNEDREDICQDIFTNVYEKLVTFQFKSKLSTWIGNIAYNTSINFLKKKKHILLNDLFPEKSDNESEGYSLEKIIEHTELNPEQFIIQKQEIYLLLEAVEQLPEIQKMVLLLFHKEELSIEQISQVTEIPVNTIKSHLFRARKSLKEIFLKIGT